jgi:hypothetical protein
MIYEYDYDRISHFSQVRYGLLSIYFIDLYYLSTCCAHDSQGGQ